MKDAPLLYRILHTTLGPVLTRYLHLYIDGAEHVPVSGGAILASNHLSFIDSLLLPLPLDRPVYYLGKAEYWESWRTRWFFEGVGVIPTYRQGGDKAKQSLQAGLEVLRRGDLLGVYPEGTRSPDGRLYRGKTGPIRLALAGDVPIVPCGVVGTRQVQPPGRFLPRRRPVTVRYGRPLDLSRYRGPDDDPFLLRSAADELMYEIMLLSGQEYVDEYAASVKTGAVTVSQRRPPPGPVRTHRRATVPRGQLTSTGAGDRPGPGR
ncbi:MAG: 1-acyl-sn-glycerol-3-phosphate acyltransferase [Actinomycetota bacterium]|nr:1-acyl-sn-glycerol-3-phosphate acyltransferase [Actinomycetota bacterium]